MDTPGYIRDMQPQVEDISAYTVESIIHMVQAGKLDARQVLEHERRHRQRADLLKWLNEVVERA